MQYDRFQTEAISAIDSGHSVLVSAPTGAGKTLIAEYAISLALSRNQRVIYTAPIKALSNQKYRDLLKEYSDRVGILTGDVSINPQADVLIMTTEIYRNQLFEDPERHNNTAWVIFDEVHYLDDYERGTVWEEAIMFSRPNTRILALSATAPNIQELADWISSIHAQPVQVIIETERPVKLLHHFQCQNEIYPDINALKEKGYEGRNFWPLRRGRFEGRRDRFRRGHFHDSRFMRAKPNNTHDLISILVQKKRLPCVYFAFGRRRVEELAREHALWELLPPEERKRNLEFYNSLIEKYDLTAESSAIEMRRLAERGIAFHHAGMLPTLKEVVEQLFTHKYIQLIFTTETFALGINMPARTVVFDELRKFYGMGFNYLTTRDYFQMAGRAGRRGMDTEGFVYARVNPNLIPHSEVARMIKGVSEPIQSQFNASYATLLHLYQELGDDLVNVYPRSLHAFQSGTKKRKKALDSILSKIQLLKSMGYLKGKTLTPKGQFASVIYGYELIISELLEVGFLDNLNPMDLSVLLAALVYEPREKEFEKRIPDKFKFLVKESRRVTHKIHKEEMHRGIFPATKPPHFHLTQPISDWMSGAKFGDLHKSSEIDEGILIRYLRMVIQLLRQIESAPGTSDKLRHSVKRALPLINRDIVDAEKLLRAL